MCRDICGMCRESATNMHIAWSAISYTQKSGTFETIMPRSLAHYTSILLVLFPSREISRQCFKLSITARGSSAATTNSSSQSAMCGVSSSGVATSTGMELIP